MKKRAVTTLFVDIGGVLLTNGWDRENRELAAKTFNLDLPALESRHRLTFDTFEIGKLSLDEYLNRIVFYEKRSFTREQFKEFIYAQSKPFPDMINLIKQVKVDYQLQIVVVSNEGRELTEYRIKQFGLRDFVDCFISSCFVHLRKPDFDIFKMALDVSQANPQEIIYLDDRAMFIQVAEGMGIPSIHHIDYKTTREKLLVRLHE